MMYSLHKLQKYRNDEDILIIAPDFNYENDEGVIPSDAFWNTSRPWGDWRAGAHSAPKSGNGRPVSAFTVMDSFALLLNDTKLWPNINEVAIMGHSAGGQMVQRYALTTQLPPHLGRPDVDLRYIVANPSSYAPH